MLIHYLYHYPRKAQKLGDTTSMGEYKKQAAEYVSYPAAPRQN